LNWSTISPIIYDKTAPHADLSRDNFPPPLAASATATFNSLFTQSKEPSKDRVKLEALLERISASMSSPHEQLYHNDLKKSFDAMEDNVQTALAKSQDLQSLLEGYLKESQNGVKSYSKAMLQCLENVQNDWIWKAILPRLSPTFILSHLTRKKISSLAPSWRKCFVNFGISMAILQRAERLVRAATNAAALIIEIRNLGH